MCGQICGTTVGVIEQMPCPQASEGIGNKLNITEGSGHPHDSKRSSKGSIHTETETNRVFEREALWLHTTATHSVSLECTLAMTAGIHAIAYVW